MDVTTTDGLASTGYPLVEFQQVTIAVADLPGAVKDWIDKLHWAPHYARADLAEFHLDATVITLVGAAEGEPTGVGRVDVGVGDFDAIRERMITAGVAVEVTDDCVVIDPAAVSGVQLALHPVRNSDGPHSSSSWLRINHLVVAVHDDEQAKSRWAALFGSWPIKPAVNGEVSHHVPVGRSWFGLTAAGTDAGALAKFVARRGEGVYALGLIVSDRAATIADLGARGAELAAGPTQTFVHPRTTHGVLLDINARG
jgi:methylmalonyl-CoA/ethylmalonyl-CoA epimerase